MGQLNASSCQRPCSKKILLADGPIASHLSYNQTSRSNSESSFIFAVLKIDRTMISTTNIRRYSNLNVYTHVRSSIIILPSTLLSTMCCLVVRIALFNLEVRVQSPLGTL